MHFAKQKNKLEQKPNGIKNGKYHTQFREKNVVLQLI